MLMGGGRDAKGEEGQVIIEHSLNTFSKDPGFDTFSKDPQSSLRPVRKCLVQNLHAHVLEMLAWREFSKRESTNVVISKRKDRI